MRSAAARAISAVGLHPTLGLHHHNQYDDMVLADDLMEPFRPLVDYYVYQLSMENVTELTQEIRKHLLTVLQHDLFLVDVGVRQ